jgi:hypothetical protein
VGGGSVSEIPPLLPFGHGEGNDSAERWDDYIEGLYGLYLKTVVRAELVFRGLPVRCQFRPETFGKHFAFWHMMQEGRIENDRTIDPERCRRLLWIGWLINESRASDPRIRVFRQNPRNGEISWVIWLDEQDYAVILWERKDYFLLKTAFMVKPHKRQEFERDWENFVKGKNG